MNWIAQLVFLLGVLALSSRAENNSDIIVDVLAEEAPDVERQVSCSATYRKSNGFLYCARSYSARSPTWSEASDLCWNTFGAYLPAILSAQDNADVARLIV